MTADGPSRAATAAARRIRWGQWLGTVGVQGLGAVATLAVGLLIAAAQGPQAQGRYGLIRSTADLLLALGLCGLPQGIVHLLNHLRVAPSRVERWMRRYLALLLLLSAGLLGGAALTGFDPLAPAVPAAASARPDAALAGRDAALAGPGAASAGPVEPPAGPFGAPAGPIGTPAGPVATPAGPSGAPAVPVPALADSVAAPVASQAADRGSPRGGEALLALAIGVFGWVVHGLQRVFVLCRGSTPRFSWVSVAPALTLFAATALLAWTGSQRYELGVAFSGLASAAWGALAMRPLRRGDGWRPSSDTAAVTAPSTAVHWAALLRPSLHALVQTAALALQPWLALQLLLRQVPAGGQEVGWFVFAGHVAQAFALPASFVAPLVFARASQAAGLAHGRHGSAATTTARRPIRTVGWVTCAVSLAAAALLPLAVPALFGTAYAGAVGACVAMALCGPALVVGRLHTALLLGEGHFAAVTLLFALRAALLPVCMLALWRWTPWSATTAAAAGWALAETLVSAAQAALRSRRDRQSPPTE